MNTISIHAESERMEFGGGRSLRFKDLALPAPRPPATWLPAPQMHRVKVLPGSVPNRGVRTLAHPVHHTLGERLFLGALALSSLAGIGYGFSCLVDLVQNWAVFGAGIGRLIQ